MKKIIVLCIFACAFVAVSAFAQTTKPKVVVVPLSSHSVKTDYLALDGGQCTYPTSASALNLGKHNFYCDLADSTTTTTAYWGVQIPNGATLEGMQVHVFTGAGTTTCELRSGYNNYGTVVASVSDTTPGWHDTSEVTFTHTVDTSTQAYGVRCFNYTVGDNAIGWIRIRYTYTN